MKALAYQADPKSIEPKYARKVIFFENFLSTKLSIIHTRSAINVNRLTRVICLVPQFIKHEGQNFLAYPSIMLPTPTNKIQDRCRTTCHNHS